MTGKYPRIPKVGINTVDVRDVAAAHVIAIEKGRSGERYILTNQFEATFMVDMCKILNEEFSKYKYKITIKEANYCLMWCLSLFDSAVAALLPIYGKLMKLSNKKSVEELGMKYIDVKTSILEMGHNLIDIGYIDDKRIMNQNK